VSDLFTRLQRHVADQHLIKRGTRLVVAVSGGVDSMVLLRLLHALAPEFHWQISVAHFNHRLRGRASAADQRLVQKIARRLRLPCDVGAANIRQAAKVAGISLEMAARQARHAFLAECARRRRARVVALAHHADDQVELFLMRLLRGAGGAGLAGMKPQSPSPADRTVRLVRPLLQLTKAELLTCAEAMRWPFREDDSNALAVFERNWVRHELLPRLRRRQPAVDQSILRSMEILGAEADFVSCATEAYLAGLASQPKLTAPAFSRLHPAVQRRVLQQELRGLGVEPTWTVVETLRERAGHRVNVGPQMGVVRGADGKVAIIRDAPLKFEPQTQVICLNSGLTHGRQQLGKVRVEWRVGRSSSRGMPTPRAAREVFDAERVGARMLLRHWRSGDRFQPIGMPRAVKLQDWFTNRKIPAARRRQLVLAESERGEVFWVEGERISEVCKVTAATRKVVEIRWKRNDSAVAVPRGSC
jgi:tRNA(Ile)-lysidine synthase